MLDSRRLIALSALALVSSIWACGGDSSDNDGHAGESGAGAAGKGGGAAGASAGHAGRESQAGETGEAGSNNGVGGEAGALVGGAAGAAGEAGEAGAGGSAPVNRCPALPPLLSLSGCAGVGPLCTVSQNDCAFTANCGGKLFAGELDAAGVYEMAPPDTTATDGTVTAIACKGETRKGLAVGDCQIKTSGGALAAPETTTCTLAFDPVILPSVTCMELPKTLDALTICKEGAAAGGTTSAAGKCSVVQDGCVFQAECQNDVVLAGTVNDTGVSFTQTLKALADAQKPTSGNPAFLKDAEVRHTCTGKITGSDLAGSCGAGASGRNGVNTSVCAIESKVSAAPPVCAPLVTGGEKLFALDSCELLKEGEGATDGIGEPVCAYRQNNCIWDVQCGSELHFGGRLADAATKKVEWRLGTGTPCEASFDANGKLTGKCTVPGQAACVLSSKTAVPGASGCPALPVGNSFNTKGCGGGSTVCTDTLQHGCNFMAVCTFSGANDLLLAGKSSVNASTTRNQLEFNGLSNYQCKVEKATAADVLNDQRLENEWFGQCTNPAGGQCRNNWVAATNTGFRGLQLFFTPPATP
jgi:hypothetical protein